VAPDTMTFDLLTMAEVAKLLHCSKAHVCNVVAGRVKGCAPIPSVRLGRRTLVRRTSLLYWIEQNDKIPASPERGRKNA
jgi:excisionase family DNA binding protein